MDLLILSRKAEIYSTRRLVEEGQKAGHTMRIWDPGQPAELCTWPAQAVIPRLGSYEFAQALSVLEAFEHRGLFSVNSSASYRQARNKWNVALTLQKYNLPMPVTEVLPSWKENPLALPTLVKFPCVIKRLESSQGEGVFFIETEIALQELRSLHASEPLLAQEWIAEAAGEDIRAFVVNKEVVASMKRKAAPGEFRSNLHLGGQGEKCSLEPEEISLALNLCEKLNLQVAGIDLLRSRRGSLLLEANPCPGLEGIEKWTQVNVAGKIMAAFFKGDHK